MKITTKQITTTAVLLAICIVSQFFKNTSVYITGPIINACLIIAALGAGMACGIILSVITPVTSFLITGSPIMSAIPAIIPCVMIGNIIDDRDVQDKVGYECYDIVAANILADVLVELTPVIVHQLKKGGIYITSGIIDDKEDTVAKAVQDAGLEVLDVTYQGEWVCVTARKN